MRRKFGLLLIAIGIILFGVYFGAQYVPLWATRLQLADSVTAEQMEKNNSGDFENDFDAIRPLGAQNTILTFNEINEKNIIGQLIIPQMGVNLPINRGTTEAHLLAGGATMRKDQTMGEGNYPLAGHYSLKEGALFEPIYRIKNGTKVYVTDKKYIYEYEIIDRKVTESDAFYMIEDSLVKEYGSDPLITLMTCNTPIDDSQRVFGVGKLVKKVKYDKKYLQ